MMRSTLESVTFLVSFGQTLVRISYTKCKLRTLAIIIICFSTRGSLLRCLTVFTVSFKQSEFHCFKNVQLSSLEKKPPSLSNAFCTANVINTAP